jgi:alanyl-tRNA synthetase/misacylated tRNA(Ala) deacylase
MNQVNIYHENYYRKEITGTVLLDVISDDDMNGVVIAENIFSPHGGGQKGDRGVLVYDGISYVIKDAVKERISGDVLLVTETALPEDAIGNKVDCSLDWDFRYRQMRLHTTVHLHHCMLEKVLNKTLRPPKTSDIQDGNAYNRYEESAITSDVVEAANLEFLNLIKAGAKIETVPDPEREGFRWWHCLSWKIPCGGTHIADVGEIGNLDISFSTKKGSQTISFQLK